MIELLILALVVLLAIIVLVRMSNNLRSEAEERKRAESRQNAARERLEGLTNKYGAGIALKLVNNEYFIGMTPEQLMDSKERKPDSIEVQQLKTKTKEIWVYGNKNSGDWFVFENGIAVKITDRPGQ